MTLTPLSLRLSALGVALRAEADDGAGFAVKHFEICVLVRVDFRCHTFLGKLFRPLGK